ncbi:helix-turn-helix transcriptional regulator [Salinimicrobium oceani]|uniref:helix-turn-helix transcriptional regulator n=1 Tax=Salinimicrobium oceani TaxID=2722702 RepID=UPI001F41DE69|nr:DNA-binding response regulator [Salinimicrobium oceani]
MQKKAIQEQDPFQLLICDLSFKKDHHEEKINSGKELINRLKQEDPNLKVLVNTIEDHPHTVRSLWNTGQIDGYVCKDRQGMRDLQEAILALNNGQQYNSGSINAILTKENVLSLGNWEMELINAIAKGLTQEEIQESFKNRGIVPSSKSSIEKRLKELREEFGANTTPHLIGILKDLKLI